MKKRRTTGKGASKAKENGTTPAAPARGSMERTRRLLLAALRVWELKRRPIE